MRNKRAVGLEVLRIGWYENATILKKLLLLENVLRRLLRWRLRYISVLVIVAHRTFCIVMNGLIPRLLSFDLWKVRMISADFFRKDRLNTILIPTLP